MRGEFHSASIAVGVTLIASACAVQHPFVPAIEGGISGIEWQISEGCRVYQYGILTDPGCDILTGEGIAVQITRVRVLNLQPAADNRVAIGIELEPRRNDWYFSSPYAALDIAGTEYVSPEIDEALALKKESQTFPEKLQPRQQQYAIPFGERRFFRLRFAVPQAKLSHGVALRVTGLQRDSATVSIPILKFKQSSK